MAPKKSKGNLRTGDREERRITFKPKQNHNFGAHKKCLPVQQNRKTRLDEEKQWKKQKFSFVKSAHAEYEKLQQKKRQCREEARNKKVEIEAALDRYKQKKKEKFKKLSAKTSKGQPIMKNRIELLLEEIQSMVK